MILSEEIACKVREVLLAAQMTGVSVEWERKGYDKTKEIVIVPHYADGEGSLRDAVVVVNIHVPDKFDKTNNRYETDFGALIDLKKSVVSTLKNYVWKGTGINWEVSSLNPPLKEPEHNEHFVSVRVTAHIREK